jgi:hypothetical protein
MVIELGLVPAGTAFPALVRAPLVTSTRNADTS